MRPSNLMLRIFGFMLYAFFPYLDVFLVGFSVADGDGGGGTGGTGTGGAKDDPANKTGAGAGNGGQPGSAAVDVQAEINKALKQQGEEFAKRFKEATGHGSFDEFQTAKAKATGETDKLLTQREQELAQTRAKLDQTLIGNALLSAAATSAIDPAVVQQLLLAKGKIENDTVTVEGKTPADAITDLLKDKPYLAKPSGGQGSGAGVNATGGNSKTRKEFEAMGAQERQTFVKGGGKVTD